ncbi:protein PRY2 isoform X4 [Hyalella azteca]|uniref:Protein PRY2 isoform X4 n=1 Tax=Hyalella azteca TaxID=294128 RepID=A0A979FSK7_HYAAZ|nr:protein PRY2 isoform X4 [Hyalella azteca]
MPSVFARKLSFFVAKVDAKMGKTTTTTETRTFQKGGKWYQETKETTVVEHKTGTNTSTKVTTKELPGPPKDHASSSSSRSPSPVRSKKASATDCGSKGLLSKLKTKVQDASSSDDEEERDEKLSKQTLVQINKKRTLHGVKALKLSPELNKEAKKWAEQLAKKDAMAHKNDEKFGENIYKLSSNVAITWERICAATPVDNWYDEIKVHKFGQEPQGGKLDSGHFTQLVWKDTKEFGFGTASSKSGLSVYFVAFFSPKGNWMGEFAQQVPPVGGFPKDSLLSNVTSKLQSAVLSSSSSDDEEEDFAEAVLKAHNKYRLKHGVAPLTISKKLNKVAEDWAKTIAKKDRMEHRPNNDYGENIYSKWNSVPNHTISGAEPVDSWYSEIKDHVFGKEPRSMVSGHFTQVVWADSRELGVGMARNKSSGKLYVVCNYNPPGNMVGSYAIKVPAPKS